jgi:hypothetical protein
MVRGPGAWHRFIGPVHGFIKPEPSADRSMAQIRLREGVLDILILSTDRAMHDSGSFSFLWLGWRGIEQRGTMAAG